MNLLGLKFEKRADETVLTHDGRVVGLYLPSDQDVHATLRDHSHERLSPATATVSNEPAARTWLLGAYLAYLVIIGSSIEIES